MHMRSSTLILSSLLFFVLNGYGQSANFSFTQSYGCVPVDIQCTDLSTNATSWDWTLTGPGGPMVSIIQNPGFTITVSGIYNIELSINGGGSTRTQSFEVGAKPNLTASVNPGNICLNESVTAMATSDQPSTQYNWYFDSWGGPYVNGGTGLTSTVQFTYTEGWAQPFTIVLWGENLGCSDSVFNEVTVNPPGADFTQEADCAKPSELHFNGNESQAIFSDQVTWNIIHGPTGYQADIHSGTDTTALDFTYDFPQAGLYEIQLLVESSLTGCTDSSNQWVRAYEGQEFSISHDTVGIGQPVIFTDESDNYQVTIWDFGDSTIGVTVPNQDTISHIYDSAGLYIVTVVTTSAYYCDDTIVVGSVFISPDVATVSGRAYYDKDGSGTWTDNDIPFAGAQLQLEPDGINYYANGEGLFNVVTIDTGQHEIDVTVPEIYGCDGPIQFELSQPADLPFIFQYEENALITQDIIYISSTDNCRVIGGTVFNDLNSNGIQDGNETGLQGIRVVANDLESTFTDGMGAFSFYLSSSQEIVIELDLPDDPNNPYCGQIIIYYDQTFPENNDGYTIPAQNTDTEDLSFGVTQESTNVIDVGLYSLRVNAGNQAGEVFPAWMDFKTYGPITAACSLRIEHSALVTLLNSSIVPTSQSDTYVEWIFPPGSAPVWHCMQMEWYLDSSAVMGETLQWVATYECPPDVDGCPANNVMARNVTIVSGPLRLADEAAWLYSMRPEGEMPEIIAVDEVLSYVIEFQNPIPTTSYSATILMQLPEELDRSTVSRPFSSYPPDKFTLSEEGLLHWELDGINLSNAGQERSNSFGFVQFNVKLKDGLDDGTLIAAKATVLFNGMEASVTNEIIHQLDGTTAVIDEQFNRLNISIYPNPFNEATLLDLKGELTEHYDVSIFNLLGNEVRTYKNLAEKQLVIEKRELSIGIYLLTIHKGDQIFGSWKLAIQ